MILRSLDSAVPDTVEAQPFDSSKIFGKLNCDFRRLCPSHYQDITIASVEKRSPKTFGVKTKRPLKFSNESKTISCPRSTGPIRTANRLSDETKKPPITFVTTKVRLRNPNR